MVDFASLRDAHFDDLKTASKAWLTYSNYLRGSAQVYASDVVGGVVKSGWKGIASEAAKREITPERQTLKRAAFTAFGIYNALAGGEKEFQQAHLELRSAINEAHSPHIRVGEDGSLTAPPLSAADRHDPESQKAWGATLQRLSTGMQAAVNKATTADQQLASALPKLFAERAWKEDLPTDLSDVPPLWPATDFGRPWGVESPTDHDRDIRRKIELMALGGAAKGWPTASALLGHWLDGSGTTKTVNVSEIMERSPEMQREIQRTLAEHSGPGKFDSGWKSANFDHRTNLDMYYAFNGYQYRVNGEGDHYTVEFYKRYNFGSADEQRNPVTLPIVGTVNQPDISHLHTTGLARDYDVHGKSDFKR